MRIHHINYFGWNGGAGGAVAMRNLHTGLRKAGIDSRIFCVNGGNGYSDLIKFKSTKIQDASNLILRKFTSYLGLNQVLDTNSLRIISNKYEGYSDSDILNFHRIYDFFSYLAIPSLTETKPAVFTLHDMWSFTGHCYYSFDCDRWKTGCGRCPHPDTFPSIRFDATRLEWKLKNWVYKHSDLTIVSPSKWLTEIARQSMLNRFPILQIPYGIDTEVFRPLDTMICRSDLGLPQDKKVIMFVAVSVSSHRKGADLLLRSLKRIKKSLRDKIVLLIMGQNGGWVAKSTGVQTVDLGYVKNSHLKAAAYSAADLFISPTRAENFAMVFLESLACGTPIIAFNTGGAPEVVRHGMTGYLAKAEDSTDMCNGIIQLLEDETLYNHMRTMCRKTAVNEYSMDRYIESYLDLYHHILETK